MPLRSGVRRWIKNGCGGFAAIYLFSWIWRVCWVPSVSTLLVEWQERHPTSQNLCPVFDSGTIFGKLSNVRNPPLSGVCMMASWLLTHVIIINFLTGGIQCHLWLLITDFAVIAVGQSSYSGTSLAGTVNKKFSTTLTSLAVVSYPPITGFASAAGDTAPDPSIFPDTCYFLET